MAIRILNPNYPGLPDPRQEQDERANRDEDVARAVKPIFMPDRPPSLLARGVDAVLSRLPFGLGKMFSAREPAINNQPTDTETDDGVFELGAIDQLPGGDAEPVPLKTYKTRITWGNFHYEISQDLPEGSDDLWKKYVEIYQQALTQITDPSVRPGVLELDLIPEENKGITVLTYKEHADTKTKEVEKEFTIGGTLPLVQKIASLKNEMREPLRTGALSNAHIHSDTPTETTLRPVGFTNNSTDGKGKDRGNLCYLNSVLTMTAGNPVIRNQITQENRLIHQILHQYRERQTQESAAPQNLEPLRRALKFDLAQQDAHEALGTFLEAAQCKLPCQKITKYTVGEEEREAIDKLPYPEIPKINFAAGPDGAKFNSIFYSTLHYEGGETTIKVSERDVKVKEFQIQFDQAPISFFGQINRFEADGTKITKDLELNPSLEITFPNDALQNPPGDGDAVKYDLVSFIVHLGDRRGLKNEGSGHYISYLRTFGHNEDGAPVDLFWEINDAKVTQISKEAFLEASKQMYIYNFNRRDQTEALRQMATIKEPFITPPNSPVPPEDRPVRVRKTDQPKKSQSQ